MFQKLSIALFLSAFTLGVAESAKAVSLNPGEFTPFMFGDAGTPTSSFDFNVGKGGGKLKVTDVGFAGDIFQVSNFGTVIGNTSSVSPNDNVFTANPGEAFNNPLFSSGSFSLDAGNQSITITPTASPFGSGTGFLKVPEPLTILGSIAAIGMGAFLKREYSRKSNLVK
ncbi:MAG: PEP-CTERM sorting domain-containing protein [Cyanobacteria bacterium P01_C01_bin.72]